MFGRLRLLLPWGAAVLFYFVGFVACGADTAVGQRIEPRTQQANRKEKKDSTDKPNSVESGTDSCAPAAPIRTATANERVPTEASKVENATNPLESDRSETEQPLWVPIQIENKSDNILSTFYEALYRAQKGEGQARITFYGASHVASDLFTGVVRQKLQERFGESGPGFVLPAKPWKWHRHSGIRFIRTRGWETRRVEARAPQEGRYGYAGVALESVERYALGTIATRPNGGLKGIASRFELYYLKQPRGGHLVVFIDGKRAKRISTYSEEYEAGYHVFEVEDRHHRFEVRAQNDGIVRVFGVAIERANPGVILDTVGIPGARAEYHLLWDDAIYREHLAKRNPDLIVLAYGTNEAGDDDVPIETYEKGLRDVMKRIREVLPNASCVLIGPSDRPLKNEDETYGPRPRTDQIVQSQRRISKEFSCGFFDLVALMGGPMSMLRWVAAKPPLGASDHVHYTYKGYKIVGEVLYQALIADYPDGGETSLTVSENPQNP